MAEHVDKILVPVVDGIVAFIGGEPPVRIDRRGIIKLRWPGVVAKIGITAVGSHKMVEISVEGGGVKAVRFSGSTISQSVRCAGMSIQRRLSKVARTKALPSIYDGDEAKAARATAIAEVAEAFPEVADGQGLPKTSFVGPISLYFNAFGTVDLTLARLSNLSAARAGRLARAIHDLLADVVGDTTEIDLREVAEEESLHG
jgi:hypothetical protein